MSATINHSPIATLRTCQPNVLAIHVFVHSHNVQTSMSLAKDTEGYTATKIELVERQVLPGTLLEEPHLTFARLWISKCRGAMGMRPMR